ncbi:hypothetical protein L0U85_09395 [Glycomyces sp. L485]|uniref:hypothetical protein n=1 Tax=Glycomyces sp. L485 TaxID=2909235 RepID=UPI001F4B1187|nr:hypothetical protein [Glycomyces sp. L485]MCH7231064.1 hypothetical protein [Glycomyces sp. L485]
MTGEEPEFTATPYGETDAGSVSDQGGQSLLVNAWCENGDCPNHEQDPAEPAWVNLMSAVPKADGTYGLTTERDDIPLPNDQDINTIVASIRPANAPDFALDRIAEHWMDIRVPLIEIRAALKTGLEELANDWTGSDYDAFEDEISTVMRNVATLVKDIGESDSDGIIGLLREKSDAIYAQQGEQAIVYPAPKFWLENTSCNFHQIHIRAPFFDTCEIHKDNETSHAIELAGFEPDVIDEIHGYREQQYTSWYNEYTAAGMEPAEAEAMATQRAEEDTDAYAQNTGNIGQEDYQARAAEVNGEITDRQYSASTEVSTINPDYEPPEKTTFNDGNTEFAPSGGLDSGSYGGAPDVTGTGGTGGMNAPTAPASLSGGGSTLSGAGSTGTGGTGLDSHNPWSTAGDDSDDLSGGLASGGSALGGGTGLGGASSMGGAAGLGGTGLGAGPGAGGMGGMVGGSGGMGAGRGTGAAGGRAGAAGSGATAGRAGASGMMGGGAGRGGTGQGGEEQSTGTWLTEDEDVWGTAYDEENDPYL